MCFGLRLRSPVAWADDQFAKPLGLPGARWSTGIRLEDVGGGHKKTWFCLR